MRLVFYRLYYNYDNDNDNDNDNFDDDCLCLLVSSTAFEWYTICIYLFIILSFFVEDEDYCIIFVGRAATCHIFVVEEFSMSIQVVGVIIITKYKIHRSK